MNIKQLRSSLGMTQIDVAVKCGVSLSSLRMWEKGVTKPNEENLIKLKEVLKVVDNNEEE